ncbi:MAG: hypothetical protein Q9213_004878 [Squamulea squamosa]
MSDEMINACMRSFDLAITRATYMKSIELYIEEENEAWEKPREDYFLSSSCGAYSDTPDTFINLESSHNWRDELSGDVRLHNCMISFGFLVSRLVPQDSPEFPTRMIPFLEPGCPDCFFGGAHPLPKYDQYYHDLRDFGALLRSRVYECSTFSGGLFGHPDWNLATEARNDWDKISRKIMDITFDTEWPEVGDGNTDVDYEGLGQLFREALNGKKKNLRLMPEDDWSGL